MSLKRTAKAVRFFLGMRIDFFCGFLYIEIIPNSNNRKKKNEHKQCYDTIIPEAFLLEGMSMFDSVIKKYRRQGYLLLDDLTVANAVNCSLNFCQAVKDPANPIIKPVEIWEGNGCTTWNGTVLYDEDTGRFRMYYSTFEQGDSHQTSYYRGGAVESADGINWERFYRHETVYKGIPTKYCVHMDGDLSKMEINDEVGPCGIEAVYDPRPECPENERYKSLVLRRFIGGVKLRCSADGIDWHYWSDEPIWYACSDIIHPFWDEKRKKFVCYYKLWKLYAEEKDETAPGGFKPMTALTYGGIKTDNRADGTTEISGQFIELHPETKAEIVEKTYIVRSGPLGEDDGGGSQLSGAWYMRRVIHWAESDDFIHWAHEQEVLDTDELDRPTSNIQLAQVFQMGGYYLALLNVHDERGHFDQQLAFSSDGIHWKRPWRGNVLGVGAPGQFDEGMVAGMLPPIITETQMLMYYGGYVASHSGHEDKNYAIGIGRAMMRKDGFACWKTHNGGVATLETVVLSKREENLYLNIDSEAGWVTAALLDEKGDVIPGYSHADCRTIRADSISHPSCMIPVVWNGKAGLPANDKLKVQLHFQNAAVYSILV